MTPRTVSLGNGQCVPYAEPTSGAATKMGKANRRTDTRAETRLRSALHHRGLRFRKDYPVRAPGHRPVRVDVAFTRARVAVFVDGCFWHGCPDHFQPPKSNQDYWGPKIEANRARDAFVDQLLASDGWTVIRLWEHEPLGAAVERIINVVAVSKEP